MRLQCDFCYHHCRLDEGERGLCSVREQKDGVLVTRSYGELVALAVDPVEKKPLYHFLPFTKTLSLAMFGCNLSCTFCQNHQISQAGYEKEHVYRHVDAKQIPLMAKEMRCPSVSFTYSEPLVWQDYLMEVAAACKEASLATIMVTNGTFSEEALIRLKPLIDAFNIDVKGDEQFYREMCNGSLKPVLRGLDVLAKGPAHVEVTTMVMETRHSLENIRTMGRLLGDLGVQVWHLSRYFPRYLCTDPPTSEAYLQEALSVACLSSIPYVYSGNSSLGQGTSCPSCHTLLIEDRMARDAGYAKLLDRGVCPQCGAAIYGRFQA